MWTFSKKSFYYQNAEFCYLDKSWVEPLAWRKSGCNVLTKVSCKSRRSFCCEIFYLMASYILECRGVATGREGGGVGVGGHSPSTSSSKPNKVQQFPFQTSGILLLTDVQKLYDQKFHDFYHACCNFWIICGGFSFFFLLHMGNRSFHVGPSEKVWYLTLDLLKCFLLWTIRKENTMNESLNVKL